DAPQESVERYLQAIVDGDASGALALWAPNVTTAERVLLDDEIYQASADRPTAFEVTDVAESGAELVDIAATLTVDSKVYDLDFTAETVGASGEGEWRITSGPLQSVAIGNVAEVASVNGVVVDLSGVSSTGGLQDAAIAEAPLLPVLPGTYTFEAPAATGLMTYGDDQVVQVLPGIEPADALSAGDPPAYVDFVGGLSPAAEDDAIQQAWDHIDSCMQSDQFVPLYCPNTLEMTDPQTVAVTNIVRTWETAPTIRFEQRGDGGVVVVEGGELRIDFEQRRTESDPWTPNTFTDRSPWGSASSLELAVTTGSDGSIRVDVSPF
ncbi:MAG: hypothetical protein ACTH31_14030, partial [Pseudoclavibacter sp.]